MSKQSALLANNVKFDVYDLNYAFPVGIPVLGSEVNPSEFELVVFEFDCPACGQHHRDQEVTKISDDQSYVEYSCGERDVIVTFIDLDQAKSLFKALAAMLKGWDGQ